MTETPERPEMLPCPFCGGDSAMLSKLLRDGYAEFKDDPDAYAYTIRCHACAAEGGWAKSESGARRWWNTRTARASSLGEPVSQEVPWVVWSHERSAWWRANRQGYAGSLFGAGVYSEDEAKAIEDDSHRGDVARLLVDEFERQSRVVGTGANWLRTQLAASRVEAKPQNPCVVFGCECPECSASVISSASPLSEDTQRLDWLEAVVANLDAKTEVFFAGLGTAGRAGAFQCEVAPSTPEGSSAWRSYRGNGLRDAIDAARLSASAPSPEEAATKDEVAWVIVRDGKQGLVYYTGAEDRLERWVPDHAKARRYLSDIVANRVYAEARERRQGDFIGARIEQHMWCSSGAASPEDVASDKCLSAWCMDCEGCGWNEGSPAYTCHTCKGTGVKP